MRALRRLFPILMFFTLFAALVSTHVYAGEVVKTEHSSNPFLVFALLAILLMALANFFKRKDVVFPAVFAAFVAAAVAVAAGFAAVFADAIVVVTATAAAASVAVAAAVFTATVTCDDADSKKEYKFTSVAFYILMVFSIIAMYW